MEIKIGDRVKTKIGLKPKKLYGGIEFIFDMLQYTGQYGTIVEITKKGYYIDVDEQSYRWSKDMLEFPDKEDLVNNPSHYNFGKYEVLDVIEDWDLGYHLGNAIKYIGRCEHKGNKIQDLEKAIFYIQREIENEREK